MSEILIPEKKDFTGRILALNTSICSKFQCGGFFLNPSRPYAMVEPGAQQDRLLQAVLDNRLVDITDQTAKGISNGESGHTATEAVDATDMPKVFIQRDNKGNILVVVPADKEDERKFDQELATTNHIVADKYKVENRTLIGGGEIGSQGDVQDLIDGIAAKLDETKDKYYKPRFK